MTGQPSARTTSADEVVDGHPVAAALVGDAAAERQPGHSCLRHHSARGGEAEGRGDVVRWATDYTVRLVLGLARRFRARHPDALPMLVGDLSRRGGGDFGVRFGIVGHSTHQNGLDVDVYYPRTDRRLRAPLRPAEVDRQLSQELVDLFVAAGAERVLVGPNLRLTGPAGVVVPYPNHDNHLHARIPDADPAHSRLRHRQPMRARPTVDRS